MNKPRTIVLTYEQGKALNMMFDKANRYSGDPLHLREYMVNCVISGHKDWKDDYKHLNKIHLNDLLYIVTGGAWEVQKTVKDVLEEIHDVYEFNGVENARAAIEEALTRLKKEGLI